MKNRMPSNIPLALVIFAAVAAVALRAATRRPRWVLGTEPAPVTATADDSRPQPAVTAGMHDTAGHGMAKPPGTPGRPDSAVEQVFHELHADGHNALCGVCDSKYWH
jgi:hypothetical protein